MTRTNSIKVFISYKHQDTLRNDWVKKLYFDLRTAGIDAKLDQYEVALGESFSDYMIKGIRISDYVLFIVTPESVKSVDKGKGAIGFEMQIANARRLSTRKKFGIIPILREGEKKSTYLSDHRYIDFRDDSKYESKLIELVNWLKGKYKPPPLPQINKKGTYIVIEGISGVGKTALADILQKKIENMGHPALITREPGEFFKSYAGRIHEMRESDPRDIQSLLLADCYNHISKTVKPSLAHGNVVISDRNFITTLVYQCKNEIDIAESISLFSFVPSIDSLILLDLEPEKTLSRIRLRTRTFESNDLLRFLTHERQQYLSICQNHFAPILNIVDSNQDLNTLVEQVFQSLIPILKKSDP